VLKLLLADKRTQVNACDEAGFTALHQAADSNSTQAVSCLLADARVDVNAQDANGNTALLVAALKGNDELVGLLLNRVDSSIANKEGKTSMEVISKVRNIGAENCVDSAAQGWSKVRGIGRKVICGNLRVQSS